MSARRIKSLHHNLREGENVVFHREHRSKKNQNKKKPNSIQFLKYKATKKYGPDARFVKF